MTPPLHVQQGNATAWRRWFAWRPVRSEQGRRIWLRSTWRRRFYPPMWFCPPAPYDGWWQYSDAKKGFWETPVFRAKRIKAIALGRRRKHSLIRDAAAEIERLGAENTELRTAIKEGKE